MALFSRDPREHWLKSRFSKNEVAKSGYSIFRRSVVLLLVKMEEERKVDEDGVARRLYKVYGSETLENGGEWQYPTNSLHRFFKVTVEMP